MQGVGETLRGTLNNEVDSRFSRHDPDKAAAANAKNRADLERGQREMAKLRERNGLQPTLAQKKSREQYGGQPLQQSASNGGAYPPEKNSAGMNGSPYPQQMQQGQPPNGVHPAYRGPSGQQSGQSIGGATRPPQHDYMRDGMPSTGGAPGQSSGPGRMNGGDSAGKKPYEYRGPQPDENPAAKVQLQSHVQGKPEPEEKKGLRGLFSRNK